MYNDLFHTQGIQVHIDKNYINYRITESMTKVI